MSLSEHMKKIRESENKKKSRYQSNDQGNNIWYNWKDGDQLVRFVGDFISTKNHYIGNNSRQSKLRLFEESAFTGDDKIPKLINCANWDIASEERIDGGCIVCKLNRMSRNVLKSDDFEAMTENIQKEYRDLKSRTDDRSSYRWNVIDRSDLETKAYKIATVGKELFDELSGICDNYQPSNFCGIEDGVDIKVSRVGEGERIKYKATMPLTGGQVKVTPLTAEEKEWVLHNLMELCGKQVDQELVFSKLTANWQNLLLDMEENTPSFKTASAKTSSAKPVSKPVSNAEPEVESDGADEASDSEEEDPF